MNKVRIFKYVFVAVALGLIVALVIVITKNIKPKKMKENIEITKEIKEDDYFYGDDIYNDYEEFNNRYILNVYGLSNLTDEEKQKLRYNIDNIYECILKMMQPKQNWNTFPISKEIREKLNNEIKEVAKYNFDKVEYSDKTLSDIEEYGSVGRIQIIGTKNKKKVMFTYELSQLNFAIVEFTLINEQVIQDVEGNEVDTRLIVNEDNWLTILGYMRSYIDEEYNQVALTNNFKSKYTDLGDAFVKQIKPKDKFSIDRPIGNDFANKSTDYIYKIGNEKKKYRIKYILDDKSYIDDVEITLLD